MKSLVDVRSVLRTGLYVFDIQLAGLFCTILRGNLHRRKQLQCSVLTEIPKMHQDRTSTLGQRQGRAVTCSSSTRIWGGWRSGGNKNVDSRGRHVHFMPFDWLEALGEGVQPGWEDGGGNQREVWNRWGSGGHQPRERVWPGAGSRARVGGGSLPQWQRHVHDSTRPPRLQPRAA